MKQNQRSGKQKNNIADNFAKKLIEQLQIVVSNIHIRFEFPDEKFSAGLFLEQLKFTSKGIDTESNVFVKVKRKVFVN